MADEILLNDQQKQAVEHDEGPLLIIAGAGTGKTTVITERIKYLIAKDVIKPEEVLALTFTEKAAREMQERVDVAMPYGYTQMWISTFHSFADRVLRDEGLQIGLDTKYKLLTEAETIYFLKDKLFEFDLHYFRPLGNPNKFVSALLQHFSRLSDEDISPTQYLKWAKREERKAKSEEEKLDSQKWLELANAYKKYEDLKIQNSFMDFSNLITQTLRLFRERPNVCKSYQEKFKYVLVDEYQDTNIAQNELVKLLVNSKQNITVVADDDQSIYKWRGAAISNVLQFRKSYLKVKVISLTQNYRSTQEILDFSYKLIQFNNPDRLEVAEKIDKKLKANKKESLGFEPELIYTNRAENEAEEVVKKIISLVENENYNFSDFAILVRANNHADPFAKSFVRSGIPHQFLGPAKLFQQEEVKELISFLKVLYSFEDSVSFYKLATLDVFNIDPKEISLLTSFAKKNNLNLFEAAEKSKDDNVQKLVEIISRYIKLISKESAGQILYNFLSETGLLRELITPEDESQEKRAYNITRFLEKIKTYEVSHENSSVRAIVEWIDLQIEVGESPLAANIDWQEENAVNILTIHSAKGLEFPVVFVVNLSSGRFPTLERQEPIPIPEELIKEIPSSGNYHLQEERRLFYVAATRAKERLYITASDYYGEGKREKKLSTFIFESFKDSKIFKVFSGEVKQLELESVLDIERNLKIKPPMITYLSHSQIETFKFCPLHYKLRYMLQIPTPTSASLSFGSTLHLVMKDLSQLLIVGKKPKLKEVFSLLEKNWISEGYSNKKHQEIMKKRGEEYIENYLK